MNNKLLVSVIIAVHNGSKFIGECLEAIKNSSYKNFETIIIDDNSTDDSTKIAIENGAVVYKLSKRSGPAAARNYGAKKARGDILLFLDCDVIIRKDTISKIIEDFNMHTEISAIIGSYDDEPEELDFFSQYRNLFHHYIHQHSEEDAKTFWCGCGAIKKDVFLKLNGFDAQKYNKPMIEDIELGTRLVNSNYKIMLDKKLQVKHLKKWSFYSILITDVFQRAVPWSLLIVQDKSPVKDLNLKLLHRISALIVILLSISLILSVLSIILKSSITVYFMLSAIMFFVLIVLFNFDLYLFFLKKRGLSFLLFSIPMHFLYYLYSSITFFICWFLSKFKSLNYRKASIFQ